MLLRITILLALLLVAGCSKESRKARYLERANRYFQAGAIDKAEIEYANVLRLDPANQRAVRQLGLIYFDQGKPGKAYPLLKRAEDLKPDDFEVRLKLASLYLAGRKFNEAQAEAEYILQQAPGHDEALVLLADSAREPAQIDSVGQHLEGIRAQFSAQPGFHVALGTLAFRQKKFPEAETAFKEAVRVGPKFALAHSTLANFYAAQNNLPAAEAAYKSAHDLSPVRSERRLDYIDFKVRNGDLATGKKLLEEIVQRAPDHLPAVNRLAELTFGEKKYAEAAALLRKVLQRDPQNFEALMTEGLLHMAQGDTPKAVAHFERMETVFPIPKVRYHLALAFLSTNNVAEAVTHLNQAIQQDPDYAEAVLLLAEINSRRGDTGTAIALLSEFIKRRPQQAEAHLLLANAHRLRNNLDEAVAVYLRLAELFPKNAQVPLFLGSVLLQQNKTNEARKSFEKALKLAPNYLPALEQVIALDLAHKQFSPALERIQQELERNPKAPELHILLAKAYYEKGETNSVEKALLRSIELDPMHREPYLLLARLYVQRNEHKQAIERLKGVIARDPRDVPALMLLGMIYNQLNNFTAAREMYEKALAVNPRFSPAINNLAYLYSEHFNQLAKAFDMAQRARILMPWDPSTADTLGWILFKREEYPWALSLLQESGDKLLSQPEVSYHLGMAQYMMGFETQARLSLERAVQMNTDFTGRDACVRRLAILAVDIASADLKSIEEQLSPHGDDPVALAKLAAAYEQSGHAEKARAAYEQALGLSPKNVSVMIKLAKLHSRQPKTRAKAMELARRARSLAPDEPSIAHALGVIAFDSGEAAEMQWAHSLLQESARKLPKDPEVLYDLAWSHFSLGQLAEATSAMRAALDAKGAFSRRAEAEHFLNAENLSEEDPTYIPAIWFRGLKHERDGQPVAAQKAYQGVLARFPLFAPAHKRLAVLFAAQGDLQRAFPHATKARELAPNDLEAAKILGVVAFKRGEFARAVQLLRESGRQRRSDAEVFYYLGMAHYRLKQVRESQEALRQAVDLKVAPPMADEANRVLAELN